ncbi:MAG TPA: OmpA family protein [Allosphingosinicella sp.]|nr:OmpA family protein [Allosphingosinicella sp.]
MIFFDWGSTAIPAQYQQTIDTIVSARESVRSHIQVVGHADSSGSSAYNLRLSHRRAKSVEAALIAKGFPKQRIVTAGRGESNVLVQTPDGTPEAKNRIVTVCFY